MATQSELNTLEARVDDLEEELEEVKGDLVYNKDLLKEKESEALELETEVRTLRTAFELVVSASAVKVVAGEG